MKLKTLLAVAVAAAFSGGALAQTGGTTQSPSVNQPQGNPPATAPAGSQKDPSSVPGARGKDTTRSDASASSSSDWKSLDKNNDGFISREEARGSSYAERFDSLDKDRDGKLSPAELGSSDASSGASGPGMSGSSTSGSTSGSTTPAPASSPSSGGPAQTQGGMGSSTSKEPK